jgi:TM2 domain-containing membrane protein YozV
MEDIHSLGAQQQSLSAIDKQDKWNAGTAAFLSFLIPGWGQMYKGQKKAGILWLVFTVVGYFFIVIPGLFIHIICMLDAAYVKPDR